MFLEQLAQSRKLHSPGVAAFRGFAAYARLESAGAPALNIHTLPFGFNPGEATGTQGIGV